MQRVFRAMLRSRYESATHAGADEFLSCMFRLYIDLDDI